MDRRRADRASESEKEEAVKSTRVVVLISILAAYGSSGPVLGADAPTAPRPNGPRAAATGPAAPITDPRDWSGVWNGGGRPPTSAIPYTPEYKKIQDGIEAIMNTLQTSANNGPPSNARYCIPQGMPATMNDPIEFVITPGLVAVIDGNGQFRNIWTDGRKHTPDEFLLDSFSGESIGHWEGDTLVVDTVNLRNGNELAFAEKVGKITHIEERIKLRDNDTLEDVMVITSPTGFTKPYEKTVVKRRDRKGVVMEDYCIPALDPYVNHATGDLYFDLTPPTDAESRQ
jgi:hypothetical protein